MKGLVLAIVFLVTGSGVCAQNATPGQPNSLKPNLPTKVYAPKVSKKKKSKGLTYEARDKFYDRLEELDKGKRRNEKMKLQPQYSNFQYFGHRKQPKKRPPEKMKYCKICGIRH